MNTVLKKWGNSLALRIPKSIAQDLRLEDGTEVDLNRNDDGIFISVGNRSRLLKLVGGITEENIHHETDTGKPVGREVW